MTEARLFVAFESDDDDETLYIDQIEFIAQATSPIFADDFESGYTTAWSAEQP